VRDGGGFGAGGAAAEINRPIGKISGEFPPILGNTYISLRIREVFPVI